MRADTSDVNEAAFDQTFVAIVFSLLGWALLEAWLLVVHAGPALHIMPSVPALCIAGIPLLRYRRYRKNTGVSPLPSARGQRGLGADTGWTLLCLALGGLLGMSILGGSAFVLTIPAAGMLFVPWSRSTFHVKEPLVSCLATWLGTGAVLAIGHHQIKPMFLPIATWVLWSCACVAVLSQLAQARRVEHRPVSKVLDVEHG
jgi:hypothetical protein